MEYRTARILMTTDTVGGVWTFSMDLASALCERGFRVLMAAMGGVPAAWQQSQAESIERLQLAGSNYKLEWMPDPWEDVASAGFWLQGLEEEFRPDLVHLNSFGHAALPWRAPVVLTAHSCVTSWWRAVRGGDPPIEWTKYRREVRRALSASRATVAPSRFMASELASCYGIDQERVHVIPNGRDLKDAPVWQKEPFVFTAGRLWDAAKNISQLARVAPRIAWPVYAAGSATFGAEEAYLPGCRCLGPLSQDELANWYARASIYVLPARYEPFGLSVVEAALAGCALVLGDIPSLREIWNGAALFVRPCDDEQLRATISGLIDNPRWRELMGQRARMRAQIYTAGRMADSYQQIYASVSEHVLACAS